MPWTQRFKLLGQLSIAVLIAPFILCICLALAFMCAAIGYDMDELEGSYQCLK